jgi:hypothetical protein
MTVICKQEAQYARFRMCLAHMSTLPRTQPQAHPTARFVCASNVFLNTLIHSSLLYQVTVKGTPSQISLAEALIHAKAHGQGLSTTPAKSLDNDIIDLHVYVPDDLVGRLVNAGSLDSTLF